MGNRNEHEGRGVDDDVAVVVVNDDDDDDHHHHHHHHPFSLHDLHARFDGPRDSQKKIL